MPLLQLLLAQSPFGQGFQPPTKLSNPITSADGALSDMERLISIGIGTLTTLAGVFFIVIFLDGCINWVTSAGEKGKLETARGKMINGVIGLVLIIISYAVIGLIGTILGFTILQPGDMIKTIVGV